MATEPEAGSPLQGRYSGSASALFWLALRTGLLTVATLGLYRFWAKTRIRRKLWSSIDPGGDALEYTGTGTEKFLGFLIAVVVLGSLAAVLAVVLSFLGFALFRPEAPGGLTALNLVLQNAGAIFAPLYFFAAYRARRYLLSRTTWRGIRFGMEPGAWGYAWRGCLYAALTGASLGLLWPLMTFRLEAYLCDRSWFGDARLRQGGRWTMLYKAMTPLLLSVPALALAVPAWVAGLPFSSLLLLGAGGVFAYGLVHYRVESFAIMARHKTAGQGIRLGAAPRPRVVALRYYGGWAAVAAVIGLCGLALLAGFARIVPMPDLDDTAGAAALVPLLAGGLALYGLVSPLRLVFVTQPVLAHLVRHAWVETPILLTSVGQRPGDAMADADGFADALDLGGAF
ncbi:DUF898 family protein [Poseidonocella sp. HB161398]|uniref:DUF898 family protein n=1 Tax=Poseidonocella sp. HB161398 TaxID=2320855 RepID=UPI001486723B|nr:DUF898 family protein [Poseidonocella sp. HB161398]